jgi:hypothetical protein
VSVKIKFKPLEGAQTEAFHDDETDVIVFSGGLGSGKTYMLCQKALKLSNINKNVAGGFLCPDLQMFKKDVLPTFEDILDKHKVRYKYHKSDKYFLFPWNRKPLYIFSGEKEIAGPNLGYCLINEFSLIRYDRIKEMLRRVRDKKAKAPQKIMGGTPEDKFAWVEEFIEAREKKGSFKLLFADTSSNHHLMDGYREELESMLDSQALKVFASGQIVRLGGEYFYYAFNSLKNVSLVFQNKSKIVYVALDFNVGKMCASFCNIMSPLETRSGKKELNIFSEIELTGDSDTEKMGMYIVNNYSPIESQTYEEFMKRPELERKGILQDIIITCDSAGKNRKTTGPSDVLFLETMGFTVRYKSSNPRMRRRQLLMNGLFDKQRIHIGQECKSVKRDFEKVQQNKQDFTKVKDKDDRLTHFSDGIDYLVEYEFGDEMNLNTSFEGFKVIN